MKINYWSKFEYDGYYHIYNRAVGGRLLFETKEHYQRFLRNYDLYFSHLFETFAYCLIPNHFHFVIRVKSKETIRNNTKIDSNISDSFLQNNVNVDDLILDAGRRWFSSHAIFLNQSTNNRGPVFVKKFKRVAFEKDKKLKYLITYLHHNPLHHGLTDNYNTWMFSSYNAYVGLGKSKISRDGILREFHGIEGFKSAHNDFKVNFVEIMNLE